MGAVVWLALWGPIRSLWHPNVHHHPLHRCYRFVDPNLEVQYVQHSAQLWLSILRIYCGVVFVLAGQELLSVLSLSDPLFWTLFSICLSSFILFCASCWRRLLFYSLPLYAFYVCALGGAYMYQLSLDAVYLSDDNMSHIYGNETSLTTDFYLHSKTKERIDYLAGRGLVQEILLYSIVHWVSLAMAGLNLWTVLAYSAVFTASIAGFMINPIVMDKPFGIFYVVVCTLAFVCVSIMMERMRRMYFLAQTQLARELQASQLADSVLNHMLKNTLADVAADIEIFLAGELGPEVLEDAVVCLRRGIRSCRERMVYLKMVAGEYTPVMNAIHLKEFGQQLVAGRRVTTHLLDFTVLMDGTLMQLILENAMSNAFKHGHPDHPNVQLIINQDGPQDDQNHPSRRQTISFIVQNATNPQRPRLTDELVHKLFHGEARLQPAAAIPTLSDGIGVLHCVLAARLGGIALSLRQEGDLVIFSATVQVDVPDMSNSSCEEENLRALGNEFPDGLTIFCLDDSASSRRLMEFHLGRWCPTAVVQTFGASEEDIEVFVTEALVHADIVIMDQNLEFSVTHHGTDLCQRLLREGFAGLICIRSSDDSREDEARYASFGAHCSFGKDMLGAKMVQRLKAAYVLDIVRGFQQAGLCVPQFTS
eukprot:GGOE01012007.1.p1 GENE.GGOE01012007.1~~GGOE01012007.1.p1  ORF type:complete len:663 (-),score=226.06 GGOE01012007.1:286-2232(-)